MPETPEQNSSPASAPRRAATRRWLMLAALLIGCLGFTMALVTNSPAPAEKPAPQAQLTLADAATITVEVPSGDYSKFSHANPNHARFTCLLCHRREGNAPQPARPGHTPCAGCHAQQFADSSSKICTICHTNTGQGKPQVKPFPRLKSFNVKFDHAQHASADCSTCHKPERGGAVLSIPAGFDAHATCYQCHAAQTQSGGRDISSCGTCHKPGRYARTPEKAKAFKVGFSHAKHSREGLSCSTCHSVKAGMAQGRQVSSPAATGHFGAAGAQTCMTCHNNKRVFGDGDFANCKRCHQGPTFRF